MWVYFFAAAAWCVFKRAVVRSPTLGGLSDESATAHLGVGPGRGNDVPLLLIYQQNLLLLFRGLKHMLYKTWGGWGRGRGQEAGNDPLPTLIQTSLENLTRDKSTDLFDLASGPVVFSQIKSFWTQR